MLDSNSFDTELEDAVRTIVGDHMGVPGVTVSLDSLIEEDLGADLGADWLDRLELIMTVEELFDVSFTQDEITSIHRVGDFVTILKRYLPQVTGRFRLGG